MQPEGVHQRRVTCAAQPVARHGGVGIRRLRHQLEQRARHRDFTAPAAPGQALDGVQRLVARRGVFGREDRRGQHQLHQHAAVRDDVGPVGIADRAQRGDGVADAQVVGGLIDRLPGPNRGQIGQHPQQPLLVVRADGAVPVLQALRHLCQEDMGNTAPREHGEQRNE